MTTPIQAEQRRLSISTPLGPDTLLLTAFSGQEELSRLFRYQLELISEDDSIGPEQIVGKGVTWGVHHVHDEPRFFHGIVSRFAACQQRVRGLRVYRAEVVPWLWLLARTTDCRIFQNKTTPEIVQEVFRELGHADHALALKSGYAKREYCVQYRETAFNFVSRLMEEEGIYYFFRHEEGKHTLMLADTKGGYWDCPEGTVSYSPGSLVPNHVESWEREFEFRPGRWAQTDYNFETPGTGLLTNTDTVVKLPGAAKYERFDYPGGYGKLDDGRDLTRVRMQEEEVLYDTAQGSGSCCTFGPGGKFRLQDHAFETENRGYLLTSVRHSARDASYLNDDRESRYRNAFRCVPDSVHFRPERLTPRPVVQGPQTAVVVGAAGEEIYVDKYGRVKVQFFWDRRGRKDESSSCWIRVAENWAGKNWGAVFHPRIGQEVVVDFLEGNPDRPLITGRVYNAEQMPPYALPANKTQSGVKTRSSQGGSPANFNEVRFEDKKGSEQLYIHAEKNQDIEVENDETHWVGRDRKKTIDRDETTEVKRDRTETVGRDEKITVGSNRTEKVGANESITVGSNRTEKVGANESITVGANRKEKVGRNEGIVIGSNRTEKVTSNEKIAIGGNRTERVGKNEKITVGGARTEKVTKSENVTVGENRGHKVGKNDNLDVGKVLVITAGDSITLKTGSASITMKKNGDIAISGKNITITGSGEIVGKATKNMTLKAKKILQN